jgi:hypothetical protein
MKALWNALRLLWLRHDMWLMDTAILEEEERHKDFDRRIKSWRVEKALVQAEIDRRRGRVKIDYAYGPTMKGTTK